MPNYIVPPQYAKTHSDMIMYNGTFNLILNIRSAFLKYGKLTDKQWAAVEKCLRPQPVHDPNVILVPACNIPIVISASAARVIARKNKWDINPCTLLVTQILTEQKGTLRLKVKADWSGSVGVCRCCGKSLTDWRSQATGVGPVCVKRTNIRYVTDQNDVARFQKEMEDYCAKLGEVEVEIKRWAFKDGLGAITSAIANAKPSPPITQTITTPISSSASVDAARNAFIGALNAHTLFNGGPYECLLSMFDWNENTRVLRPKPNGVKFNPPADCNTIMVHNPITGNHVEFRRQSESVWWSVWPEYDKLPLIAIIDK